MGNLFQASFNVYYDGFPFRLVISVLPAVLLGAFIVVAWFYPITRRRYAEINRELARRRAFN